MKLLIPLFLLTFLQISFGQVELKADGPGDTYELITSVLAPDYSPIEAPDCSHTDFGHHIDEVFDEDLDDNVFRFFIHSEFDDDRCINFDRQRNEIKTYDKSPENLLGRNEEKVEYVWKFKLPEDFQSSPKFTHLHQLKSVGGDLASMPMYTLTTRKGNPDDIELRYAETDNQITLKETGLEPFIGHWVEVKETIKYGLDGTYDIVIKRIEDDEMLFEYSNESIVNWRLNADFVRPKWGIYRSLEYVEDLRDEVVLFADFSIEELESVSTNVLPVNKTKVVMSNPVTDRLILKNMPTVSKNIQIINIQGEVILTLLSKEPEEVLNVFNVTKGVYILKVSGENYFHTESIVVHR